MPGGRVVTSIASGGGGRRHQRSHLAPTTPPSRPCAATQAVPTTTNKPTHPPTTNPPTPTHPAVNHNGAEVSLASHVRVEARADQLLHGMIHLHGWVGGWVGVVGGCMVVGESAVEWVDRMASWGVTREGSPGPGALLALPPPQPDRAPPPNRRPPVHPPPRPHAPPSSHAHTLHPCPCAHPTTCPTPPPAAPRTSLILRCRSRSPSLSMLQQAAQASVTGAARRTRRSSTATS